MSPEEQAKLLDALARIDAGAWLEKVQPGLLAGLSAARRPEATAILRGVIEERRCLDWILGRFVRHRPRSLLKQALRLGLYRLRSGHAAHAVLNTLLETLAQCHPKERGLVNAVLRNYLRKPLAPVREDFPTEADFLRVVHGLPFWLQTILKEHGLADSASQLEASRNWREQRRLWMRRETQIWPLAEAKQQLADQGLRAIFPGEPEAWFALEELPVGGLENFPPLREGRCRVQDLSTSGAVSLVTQSGAKSVLDLCAAPGGKALAIHDQLPGAELTLVEADKGRARELSRRLDAMQVIHADGRKIEGSWDCVLLDVPCSGSGSAMHRPDMLLRDTDPVSKALLKLQAELLAHASRLVAPGGRLVYSTCSLDARENQQQIGSFLNTHRDWYIEKDAVPVQFRDTTAAWAWIPWRAELGAGGAWAVALSRGGR